MTHRRSGVLFNLRRRRDDFEVPVHCGAALRRVVVEVRVAEEVFLTERFGTSGRHFLVTVETPEAFLVVRNPLVRNHFSLVAHLTYRGTIGRYSQQQ